MSEHPEIVTAQAPHLSDEQLAAWVADELASDERGTAMRHLTSCDVCRSALAETQRIQRLVRATGRGVGHAGHADVSVVERVLARLGEEKTSPAASGPGRREKTIPSRGVSAPQSPQSRRRDVWRRVGALAAVLLLIAMSALLFTRLSGRGPAVTSTSTFTPGPDPLANIPGNWTQVLPERGEISDVAVISPRDIWAVGYVRTPDGSGSQDALLLHFDGREWRRSPENFPGAGLLSVSMVSADEGWASGVIGAEQPFLLHFTNGHWRDARASISISNTPGLKSLPLFKLQMASATSGWMLAQPMLANQTQLPPTDIYEYYKVGDGYRWEPVFSFDGVVFSALADVSDHEVWFVGSRDQTALAIRMTITVRISASDTSGPGSVVINRDTREFDLGVGNVTSISMRSATDGWAAGNDETYAGTLYHWDGATWTPKPFVQGNYKQAGIDGVVMTGENTGWVYNWSEGYLYSTADNKWFSYPLGSDEKIEAGAALTPTTFLAFRITVTHPQGPDLKVVPVVFTMGQGTVMPTPTSIAP